jgi:peptidoglycan/xylan/chitin deacetylase (PgdA/CDA1 family)
MSPAPALLYHAVCSAPAGAVEIERRLFLHPDRFAEQMEDLARRGFRSISLAEYAQALEWRKPQPRTVLLTFDDAYAHVDQVATPVLRRHGFRAVMFAPWEHLGGYNTWDAARSTELAQLEIASPDQLRSLDPRVWEVASHGLRHVDLRKVPAARRWIELRAARVQLSELLGQPVVDLAYPYGAQNGPVRRDAHLAGYRMAFTEGYARPRDRFQLPRWPVGGDDTWEAFRLKTSKWSLPLYRVYRRVPAFARQTARVALRTR